MSLTAVSLRQIALAASLAWAVVAHAQTAVQLTSTAAPNQGQPGISTISVTGSGFPSGTIVPASITVKLEPAVAGAGPTVETAAQSVTTVVGSTRRVAFLLPSSVTITAPTPYLVSIAGTTSDNTRFASSNKAALTVNPAAALLSATPATAQAGQSVAVVLQGVLTGFAQGTSTARFGAGISVGGGPVGDFGPIIVIDPTTAVAVLQLAVGTSAGTRELTVRTGTEEATLTNGWRVGTASPSNVVRLSSPTEPAAGIPGSTIVVFATEFPDGPINASQMRGLFEPETPGAGPTFLVTATALEITPTGRRRVSLRVPTNVSVPVDTGYLLTLYGSSSEYGEQATGITFASVNRAAFTLTSGARLSSVNPNTGRLGQTLDVALTGLDTDFAQGASQASFGSGVAVGGAASGAFGPITVTSPTTATARLVIAAGAALGVRSVQVRTGTQIVALPNGFTVQPIDVPPAVITSVTPNSGQQGTTFTVAVTGQNTSFGPTTVFSFDAGIAVSNISIASATQATMRLSLSDNAALGNRTVTATTGSQVATLANGFTVQVAPPVPTLSVTPATGQRGAIVNATVTGQNTNFGSSTVFSFGAGITVSNINVASATSASLRLTIASDATLGGRTVTATTGAQVVTRASGFTVQEAPPPAILTSVSPNSGRRGATLDVTIEGENTSFGPSTTFSFGAGITVANISIASATRATMRLTLAADAALGSRTIRATTGTQIAELANGFTVQDALTPVITSVTPSSGQRGATVDVTVIGGNTGFNATTVFSLGAGITVSNVNAATTTQATMRLTIAVNAALGGRIVTATTGSQTAQLANGFAVEAAPTPRLISVTPNSGQQGTNVDVVVIGENTSFNSSTTFNFGAGITIAGNVTITTATRAAMRLTLAASSAVGARTVTATTGTQVATLDDGFTVESGTVDTTPPTLTILSPTTGTTLFINRPPFEISYSDPSGVDTASLTFRANGNLFAAECDLSATGGRCTPILSATLPEGSVTLVVSVADTRGNRATASVTVTVDSTRVQITLSEPANRLITKDPQIRVRGTVGANVQSVNVNGVPATLSAGSFTANVPLREGTNAIVALGTAANGKTGTASIDVTRDIVAPIVRIDSPRNGFVAVEDKIDITGLVNDVVTGGVISTVKVNGKDATVNAGTFVLTMAQLVRGPNTIEAVGRDAVGNTGRHSIRITYQPPVGARISMASGNGQFALVNQTLAQPFVAQVKDDLGNPVAGKVIRFEVTRNSGLIKKTATDAGTRIIEIPSDGSGKASVLLMLGDTAGEGNNRVKTTALGVAGEVEFCASAQPLAANRILMTGGDNQRGVVSNPLATPLEALVVDRDGNPITNIDVTFRVTKGIGNLNGNAAFTTRTNAEGMVRAILTLGSDPGLNNNVVSASYDRLTGMPATFTASGLAPGNPAQTKFSGVVLDNGLTPIPVARVFIPGTNVSDRTDAQGQFELTNVPVGAIHLRIEPARPGTAGARPETFPPLEFETVTVAGQVNQLGQPILIPKLDIDNDRETDSSRTVGGTRDVTLKMTGVAGLELTIFAGSATFGDGSKTGRVTISQVHLDKVPMPPPNGTIFMPPAWTIQPHGVKFNPPARISIPNDGLKPGRVIDLFQFDHTLYQFINIGKGTVSADASVVVSDPGFGITTAGWGGGGQPPPPTTCTGSCDDGNRCTSDGCQNGSCTHTSQTEAQTKANGCKGCDAGTPKEPKTDAECCAAETFGGGYVMCCNGNKLACVGSGIGTGGNAAGGAIVRACAFEHEREHFKHVNCPAGATECLTTRQPFATDAAQGECDAYKVEAACLQRDRGGCGADADCLARVDRRVTQARTTGNSKKPGCFSP